jgi:hypothetical protein
MLPHRYARQGPNYHTRQIYGTWMLCWCRFCRRLVNPMGKQIADRESAFYNRKWIYSFVSSHAWSGSPTWHLRTNQQKALKCQDLKPTVKCTVFEDNNVALELATAPKMRPRTKHIAIKYHHFWSAVNSGAVQIKRVDTKNLIADIFTKALLHIEFKQLRVMLLGW